MSEHLDGAVMRDLGEYMPGALRWGHNYETEF